ncbi:hypothetical protein [Pseudolysinimonas sp.]|jgi:hypothetical protein|uniref:hypothetical protein n=1 Tax=Pseudolysinimonas sp. TaxID=2680009 RepID=UPI003785116D
MPISLIVSRQLRARGDQTRSLEVGVRRGTFIRIRPGVYVVADEWRNASAHTRHLATIDALVATSARVPVFSHESAALLRGMPVIGAWPTFPHTVASDLGHRAPVNTFVHRPRHPWPFSDIDGYLATTPIGTALDLAAKRTLASGVAMLDRVLATGTSTSEIAATIDEWKPFHGARRAERALEIATGLAESPLESISLVPIALAGFARPQQQIEVIARGHRYRLDFFWPDQGVVGEADGRDKYRSPADLWEEKQREDALRSIDLRVARWGWDEALAGSPVVSRLVDAGLRAGPPYAKWAARIS